MILKDAAITNDFDVPLFVRYNDRHNHFLLISPGEKRSLSLIIRNREVYVELLDFWLQDFKTHEFQKLHWKDITMEYSSLEVPLMIETVSSRRFTN